MIFSAGVNIKRTTCKYKYHYLEFVNFYTSKKKKYVNIYFMTKSNF